VLVAASVPGLLASAPEARAADEAPAAPSPAPGPPVTTTVDAPDEDGWVMRSVDGERVCTLPCRRALDPRGALLLVHEPSEESLALPQLADSTQPAAVTIRPVGSTGAALVLAISTGFVPLGILEYAIPRQAEESDPEISARHRLGTLLFTWAGVGMATGALWGMSSDRFALSKPGFLIAFSSTVMLLGGGIAFGGFNVEYPHDSANVALQVSGITLTLLGAAGLIASSYWELTAPRHVADIRPLTATAPRIVVSPLGAAGTF
jgi:hypothetical protein